MTPQEYRDEAFRLYNGDGCEADKARARELFLKAADGGDQMSILRYCNSLIERDQADESTVEILENLVRDEENPCADACAILYTYYSRLGDEEMAAEWMECGLEMGSELMQSILDDEREEEVGEDN